MFEPAPVRQPLRTVTGRGQPSRPAVVSVCGREVPGVSGGRRSGLARSGAVWGGQEGQCSRVRPDWAAAGA